MRFRQREKSDKKEDSEVEDLVQVALKSEINLLEVREKILGAFKVRNCQFDDAVGRTLI